MSRKQRDVTLCIRLNRAERKALDRMAEIERAPVSTVARKILLQVADALDGQQAGRG